MLFKHLTCLSNQTINIPYRGGTVFWNRVICIVLAFLEWVLGVYCNPLIILRFEFYESLHLCHDANVSVSLFAHTMVPPAGHGPLADLLEGRGGAGLLGHLPGDVDPPAGVAALRCPHAPRESRLRVVNPAEWRWSFRWMFTILLSLYLDHMNAIVFFFFTLRTNWFWKNMVKLLTFLYSVNSVFCHCRTIRWVFILLHDRIFAKKHFDIVNLYLNLRDIKHIIT